MSAWSISYPSGAVYKDGVGQTDLAEWIAFLAGGGTPEPLQDAPTRDRIEVSAWQLMQELIAEGLYDQVDSAVMASGDKAMIAGWTRAPYFSSDHPLTLSIGAQLGKTEDEMYALFGLAKGR